MDYDLIVLVGLIFEEVACDSKRY